MTLSGLLDVLEAEGVEYAVAGGYALALHGAVRGTVDVDLVLKASRETYEAAERALRGAGYESQLPVPPGTVFEFRREYVQRRNLIAWTFGNAARPNDVVHVVLTHDLDAVRVKKVRVGKRTVPIVALDDLIAMKRRKGRPQDVIDVGALERLRT